MIFLNLNLIVCSVCACMCVCVCVCSNWLKTSISLMVVMGITWIIGVLVFHKALVFVAYIFTIVTAFQVSVSCHSYSLLAVGQ